MNFAVRILDACDVRGWRWCCSAWLIAGCGSGNNLATVRGKVTLNGRPLQGALVEFQPTAPGGSPSSGITDAEGRYELMYTFDKRGRCAGRAHRVDPHRRDALSTRGPRGRMQGVRPGQVQHANGIEADGRARTQHAGFRSLTPVACRCS